MKKLFMLLVAAVSTITTAWGQTASFSDADDGKTLVVTASGDLTSFSTTDNSKRIFTSNAVNEVFTNNTGTSVAANDVYNSSSAYFVADKIWSKVTDLSTVTTGYTINGAWVQDKMNGILYHKNYDGQTDNPGQGVGVEEYTRMNGYYGTDFNENTSEGAGMSYYYEKNEEDGTYTCISLDKFKSDYYTVSSITFYPNANLYVSTDDGLNKSLLGTAQHTLADNETFWTFEATYAPIPNNETFFGTTHPDYLQVDPVEKSFVTLLADKLTSGSYNKVEFVNSGAEGTLIIDPAIIKAITHPGGEANTKLTTLDLGETTTTSFVNAFNQTTLTSLESVTLPMAVKDGDDMVLPGNIFGTGYTWTTHNLTTVTVPEGYTKIGDRAFYEQSAITTVNLPSSLIEIGNDAMYGMTKLNDVELPNKLEVIGERAFKNCVALSDPVFPASLRKIMGEAYCQIDNIKNLKFNDGLEFIGNSAFYCNHKVVGNQETLQVPATVKYIGPGALTGRWYKDVYFYSEYAPLCPLGKATASGYYTSAFDDNIHMGNNGFIPLGLTVGDVLTESNADDIMNGYANRDNYINHDYYLCMLHFPTEEDNANGRADDKAKTYTDITRLYVNVRNADGTFYKEQKIPVGSEASCLSYDNGQVWSSTLTREVTTGYEDTYKGKQYIWPSQSQWMRSFVNNSLGLEWDGVTEYRPTLTSQMIDLMIEDKLIIKANGSDVTISTVEGTFTFDDASAAAYNETLPGAIKAGSAKTTWTKEDADAHNAGLDNAVSDGQTVNYTEETAAIHNATLPGAVHEGEDKVPATDIVFYTADELLTADNGQYAWVVNNGQYEAQIADYNNHPDWYGYLVKTPASPAIPYTADEAKLHNADLDGAVKAGDLIATFTAETAAAYNATLPGAVREGDGKDFYSADEAKEANAKLSGAKKAGDVSSSASAYSDELSKIAYLGTRQFVFADGDHAPSHDYILEGLEPGKWWTICVPFNMTKKMIDDVFGEDTHVCLFSAVERSMEPENKHLYLKFQHDVYAHKTVKEVKTVNENKIITYAENWSNGSAAPADDDIVIYAHESYMIFPKAVEDGEKDAVEYVVPFPEVLTGSPIPTIINASDDIMTLDDEIDYSQYRFIGNYSTYLPVLEGGVVVTKPTKVPTYSYMYAKKKSDTAYKFWFYTGNTTAWKPNKSLVQNTGTGRGGGLADLNNFFTGSTEAQAKQVSYFGMADDEITAVEDIVIIAGEGEDATTLVYGVNGQLVDMNSIKAGNIYIKNGKKFLAQ